jgi:hypothetical protein
MDTDKVQRRRRIAIIQLARRLPELVQETHKNLVGLGSMNTTVDDRTLSHSDDLLRQATEVHSSVKTEMRELFMSTNPSGPRIGQFNEVFAAYEREWKTCFWGIHLMEMSLRNGSGLPPKEAGITHIQMKLANETLEIDALHDITQSLRILRMAGDELGNLFPVDERIEATRSAHTIIEEYIMGDKFENISNSTIVNRSSVGQAFNKYSTEGSDDVAKALRSVADYVDESGNVAAAAVFDQFTAEVTESATDRSRARQLWDGLVAILPGITSIAGAAEAIAKIFT